MSFPHLNQGWYPIVDPSFFPDYSPLKLAEEFLRYSPPIMQFRHKQVSRQKFLQQALELAYLKVSNNFKLILNTHWDLVEQVGADGVHLPEQSEISIQEVREHLGSEKIIGASVHSIETGIQRAQEGADYLQFGAIFPSKSKPVAHPIQGIEKLKELVDKMQIPVIAIGGIDENNVSEIQSAGALGFCLFGGLNITRDNIKALIFKES